MKYENLGTTNISVSKICIGGMSFGKDAAHPDVWALDEKETEAMIGHAFDLGVNFIDTANAYAMGRSEEMIGKAVRSLGIPRDKIIIATKVFPSPSRNCREKQKSRKGTIDITINI